MRNFLQNTNFFEFHSNATFCMINISEEFYAYDPRAQLFNEAAEKKKVVLKETNALKTIPKFKLARMQMWSAWDLFQQ